MMKKTGRAAVYEAPNEPFVIREYAVRDCRSGEPERQYHVGWT